MNEKFSRSIVDYLYLLIISLIVEIILLLFIRPMLRKFFGSDDDVPLFYIVLFPLIACSLGGFITLIIRHEKKSNFTPTQLFLVPLVQFGLLWVTGRCLLDFIGKLNQTTWGLILFATVCAIASWEASIFLISAISRKLKKI